MKTSFWCLIFCHEMDILNLTFCFYACPGDKEKKIQKLIALRKKGYLKRKKRMTGPKVFGITAMCPKTGFQNSGSIRASTALTWHCCHCYHQFVRTIILRFCPLLTLSRDWCRVWWFGSLCISHKASLHGRQYYLICPSFFITGNVLSLNNRNCEKVG